MVSVFALSQMKLSLPDSLHCAFIHHLFLFNVRIQNQNLPSFSEYVSKELFSLKIQIHIFFFLLSTFDATIVKNSYSKIWWCYFPFISVRGILHLFIHKYCQTDWKGEDNDNNGVTMLLVWNKQTYTGIHTHMVYTYYHEGGDGNHIIFLWFGIPSQLWRSSMKIALITKITMSKKTRQSMKSFCCCGCCPLNAPACRRAKRLNVSGGFK